MGRLIVLTLAAIGALVALAAGQTAPLAVVATPAPAATAAGQAAVPIALGEATSSART